MKYWEQTLATYMHNHGDICNILIYFCNIHLKHLQRTSKTLRNVCFATCFSAFFRAMQSKSRERPVSASRRPRMVAWPGSG